MQMSDPSFPSVSVDNYQNNQQFTMHFQPKRKSSSNFSFSLRYVLCALPILFTIIFVTQLPLIRPPISELLLPPQLSLVMQHSNHIRPLTIPSKRPEWKRPRVLTAHVTRLVDSNKLNVAIFTTGTDTRSYGRTFQVVGCQIGKQVYRATMIRPEVTTCEIAADERRQPKNGDRMSVLLRVDSTLKRAMEGPEILSREVFKLEKGDVEIVPANVSEIEDGLKETEYGVVRSSLTWNKESMTDVIDSARPRWEVCMMTAMKQYPYLLDGWAEYYRRMGVDRMFIFDNLAEINLRAYMSKYDFVEVVYWPFTRSQMQSFTFFLRASKARCKYVAFFDADEYIMTGTMGQKKGEEYGYGRGALRQYIKYRMEKQKYAQVISHFIRFLNNGYVKRPQGSLPLLYTRREKDQAISLGKAIINTDHKFLFHKIHLVEGGGAKNYWNETVELDPTSAGHNAMLMHYTERSWEENVLKNRFGGSSPMTTYRKPIELDVNKPDKTYMDLDKSVKYEGFVWRFKDTMKLKIPKREVLVWKKGSEKWCKAMVCRSCWWNVFSDKTCA